MDGPPNMRSARSSLWKMQSNASRGSSAQLLLETLLDSFFRFRLRLLGAGGDSDGIDGDVGVLATAAEDALGLIDPPLSKPNRATPFRFGTKSCNLVESGSGAASYRALFFFFFQLIMFLDEKWIPLREIKTKFLV